MGNFAVGDTRQNRVISNYVVHQVCKVLRDQNVSLVYRVQKVTKEILGLMERQQWLLISGWLMVKSSI